MFSFPGYLTVSRRACWTLLLLCSFFGCKKPRKWKRQNSASWEIFVPLWATDRHGFLAHQKRIIRIRIRLGFPWYINRWICPCMTQLWQTRNRSRFINSVKSFTDLLGISGALTKTDAMRGGAYFVLKKYPNIRGSYFLLQNHGESPTVLKKLRE